MLDKIFYVANNLYTFKITTVHFIACLKKMYMIHSFHCWGNLPYTKVSQNIVLHPAWINLLEFDQYLAMWRTWTLQLKIQF
jgi:hypothetical protein